MLRDQGEVFGPVASTPTAWRLLAAVDERALDRMRSARARAGEVAWPQHRTLFDELTAFPVIFFAVLQRDRWPPGPA